ncbi:MAG: Modification methylase HaeIII [Pelotomaculum sp. PtaU1.Bin065]|nr:MAG: Modification methylase HaeIII [Pelotomaculum sp. PtaU1.Bin065]
MIKTEISVAGLFVGCGGLDYGFKKAGFNLVWANELSKDAAESYETLIGHKALVGDIWDVIGQVPKVDVIIGGPPCQSFSLVGKRLEDDPRGKLVFAYQQIIYKVRPLVFLMENVPGLMASRLNDEKLHFHLAREYRKYGYDINILKLDATDYFVPQRRKRFVMIGSRMKSRKFKIISQADFLFILKEPFEERLVTVSEALDDLPPVNSIRNMKSTPYLEDPHSAYSCLMRKAGKREVTLHDMPTMSRLDKEFVLHIPPGGNYMDIPDRIATKRILTFKKTGGRTTTYGRLHPDYPAYTLNTYFNRPNVGANYHHKEDRLITVREALRLQSFPDDFTPKYNSQRSLYMQVGNAVPPLMSYALAESIKRVFR